VANAAGKPATKMSGQAERMPERRGVLLGAHSFERLEVRAFFNAHLMDVTAACKDFFFRNLKEKAVRRSGFRQE
jgi:hypothetical protein